MILETPVDPLAFKEPMQVIALAILVFGGLIAMWLKNISSKTNTVVKTLTENNHGSHIKDQLDRIEAEQQTQKETLVAHGQIVSEHIKWAMTVDKRVEDLEDVMHQLSPDELEQDQSLPPK